MLREIVEGIGKTDFQYRTYLEYPADVKNMKGYLDDNGLEFKSVTKNGMTRFEFNAKNKDVAYIKKTFAVSVVKI